MTGIRPSLDQFIDEALQDKNANLFLLSETLLVDSLTPHTAYVKLARPDLPNPKPSFIFESAVGGEKLDRYSYIGQNPRKVIRTGNGHGPDVDPLIVLEKELAQHKVHKNASYSMLPPLHGGAVGYISYDCVRYFEPRTKRDQKDALGLPEAAFMLFDTIVAFDNVYQKVHLIQNVHVGENRSRESLIEHYENAVTILKHVSASLNDPHIPVIPQSKLTPSSQWVSNIGKEGYISHVRELKEHIVDGDIIQAVPSQRIAHPTDLHPLNIYWRLRRVNPSPYLFYIDMLDFQIVGASPELLAKIDEKGRVVSHPIAGTARRGKTIEEDDRLSTQLLASTKDRAEHIMLVDLARNDLNRVCDPKSMTVDRLLTVERFSHVMHLVSEVSGRLRAGKTRFDALRSIFPAGTVSGAPKVKAMELIAELEEEKRGVYAGAVGYWGYDDNEMNTCIALRTLVVKDKVAYLQAGGGIVFDSDELDEYEETMNKMKASRVCLEEAEAQFTH